MLDSVPCCKVVSCGWTSFDVFLHQPGTAPTRLKIPRQGLLFKVVDGQPQPARHFYPRPDEVWVRRINSTLEAYAGRSAFTVEPEKDSVEALAEAILETYGMKSPQPLRIYKPDYAGKMHLVENEILFANREKNAYGFYVPE